MSNDAVPKLAWDLFCRVVDNHGDLGVCWRLARRLVALGQQVRLWIDDPRALAWMAPGGAVGVQVESWREPRPDETPGDIVVEAFGCDPPSGFVAGMAAMPRPPVWINLEYLSAEPYVARSHGLPSPQGSGPGAGLRKWFYFPGFTPDTGGLLAEPEIDEQRASFDAAGWLAGLGIVSRPGARRVSLFCYRQPALADALADWCRMPTQLLLTPGPATEQVTALLGAMAVPGAPVDREALQAHALPWLPQPEFDHLLWACQLNFVRGEDSLVRALWAGRPFVWQLYPQHDGAHAAKLEAFLGWYLAGAESSLAQAVAGTFRHWNGLGPATLPPDPAAWERHATARCQALGAETRRDGDLGARLLHFALERHSH